MRLEYVLAAAVAASLGLAVWAADNRKGGEAGYPAGAAPTSFQARRAAAPPEARGAFRPGRESERGGLPKDGRGGEIPFPERVLKGFAGKAYAPPGTWLSWETARIEARECPSKPFGLEAFYPQGLDGGGPVDRAIKAYSSTLMADAREAGESLASSERLCGFPGPAKVLLRGRPYRSSPSPTSVASALFLVEAYRGGGGGSAWYGALNLLPDGRELTLEKLFPDPSKGLENLRAAACKTFCPAGPNPCPPFCGAMPFRDAMPMRGAVPSGGNAAQGAPTPDGASPPLHCPASAGPTGHAL
ncbi:MAG: hypothetical protein LBQ12_02705, partial [Deltaproteobacteria bacterium]|nr:hypothetical protein [Deltaproteobacteria bacterium]